MTDKTRPISIRLADDEFDALTERARRSAGTPTALARDLIRTGLREADAEGQATRLLKLERRVSGIADDVEATLKTAKETSESVQRLAAMFNQLLEALSGRTPPPRPDQER